MEAEKNVLGTQLETCGLSPPTGFHRDGNCRVATADAGIHGVCSEVTETFLTFTESRGNDLSIPSGLFGFPGLKPGDRWWLCASRWMEALNEGVAPPVVLSATSESVLKYLSIDDLILHAVDTGQG